MTLTPEQIQLHLDVLRRHRHELVQQATPDKDGSLVPMLKRSATCCAIDVAVAALEAQLKGVAS